MLENQPRSYAGNNIPSTTSSEVASKIEGVIQGSKTNQPPRLTPLIVSPPMLKFEFFARFKPTGAGLPKDGSKAAAARTAVEILKDIVSRKNFVQKERVSEAATFHQSTLELFELHRQ
jgi:hypothetical protein